ncbi:hypothetical protein MDAP_001051 [Mitosporidium daphniae]
MTVMRAFVIVLAIGLSAFFSFNITNAIPQTIKRKQNLRISDGENRFLFYVSPPQATVADHLGCNDYVMITWNLIGYFPLSEIGQISYYEVFIAPKRELSDSSAWKLILPRFPIIIEELPGDTQRKSDQTDDDDSVNAANIYFLFRDKIAFYPWSDTSLLAVESPLVVLVKIHLNSSDDGDYSNNFGDSSIVGISDAFSFPNCFVDPNVMP